MSDRFQGGIVAGATSVSIDVVLRTAADGTETINVAHTSVTAYYWRQGGSPTAITLSALTNINDAWSAGGWKQADAINMKGSFRLDVPNAAYVAGADWVEVDVTVAGCFVFKERFYITANIIQTGDVWGIANNGTYGNAALKTLIDAVGVLAAAIAAKTVNLPANPAAIGDQMALTAAYDLAKTAAQVGSAVNATQIAGSTQAATNLGRATLGNVLGIVGTGSTTTSIVPSSLDPSAAATDQFKGRNLVFDRATTTAQLRGQGTTISGMTSGGVLTVSALSAAPQAGDTFAIT